MSKRSNLNCSGFVSLLVGALLVASPALGQEGQTTRYPVTEAAIAQFLNRMEVYVAPSQVHLPMALTSKSYSPDLEITSVEPAGNDTLQVGFRCAKGGECLPFNAIVDGVSSTVLSAKLRRPTGAALDDSTSGRAAVPPEIKSPVAERDKSSGAILKAGTRVRLVIRSGHMEIHMPVLAMESGAAGKEVRLCSLDRKKSFRATVIDDKSVIGSAE